MLYRGYWIEFVDLTSRSLDGSTVDAVFLIRLRHSREILAEVGSISQALEVIRELIRDGSRQGTLNLGGAA